MRQTTLIIGLVLISQILNGQSITIDTLLARLDTIQDPVVRGAHLVKLADAYRQVDLKQMKNYLDQASGIEAYASRPDKALKLQYMYGSLAERQGRFDTATAIFENIITQQREQITDSTVLAYSHYKLGDMGRRQGKTEYAINHLLTCKELRASMKDATGVASADVVLGIIYKNRGLYDEAIQYYASAYDAFAAADLKNPMASCVLNIANVYTRQEKYEEAIPKYQEALELGKKLDQSDNLKAFVYGNLSNLYSQMDNPGKALEYAELSFNLRKGKAPPEEIATSLIGIANSLRNLDRPNEAIAKFKEAEKAVDEAPELLSTKSRIYQGLYLIYKEQSRISEALAAHEKYKYWTDSLHNTEIEKEAFALNEKYESDKKEQEINLLNVENELNATKLSAQKNQLIGLLVGFLIVLGLLIIAFLLFRKTKAQNGIIETALQEKDILLREIHHRVKNNLQFISSLLGLQTEHVDDPTALGALQEGQDRVQSMALIHQNLYQEDNLTGVDVKDYFIKLIRGLFDSYNIRQDQVELQLDIDELNLDVDTVVPIGLIVNELVSNSLKYAFKPGQSGVIKVHLGEERDMLHLLVKDSGIGMDPRAMEHLGSSFGYRLVKVLQVQLNAELDIKSKEGTEVSLRIKKYQSV